MASPPQWTGFGWTPGVGDGHGGLACCDSWGHKESDMTEQLNEPNLVSQATPAGHQDRTLSLTGLAMFPPREWGEVSWRTVVPLSQFSSVTQSCLTLCDPMDCSMPDFPVLHHLPELAQTYVHESMMPSNHLILCCPLLLLPSIFPSIRVFSKTLLFISGGQSIGASASSSVLPVNIQG